MINTDNIGKRIRTLRKHKHISQERLAEDLGMYQADISNLERAIGGSGITDLFKLDIIADYFGITLTELLIGSDSQNSMTVSESIKSEEYKLQDYILENVLYGSDEDVYVSVVNTRASEAVALSGCSLLLLNIRSDLW